jgi:hypothetical protein
MKVPSAKFHGYPFSKGGAYTDTWMDGLTGHDKANGLLSRLSERAWKRRVLHSYSHHPEDGHEWPKHVGSSIP